MASTMTKGIFSSLRSLGFHAETIGSMFLQSSRIVDFENSVQQSSYVISSIFRVDTQLTTISNNASKSACSLLW